MEHKYFKTTGPKGQWHILTRLDDTGRHARCGVSVAADGSFEAASRLRVNEATCNSCMELAVADSDKAALPTPEDGAVPE